MSDNNLKLELQKILNSYSVENDSNTPDFILAEYLLDCLNAFEKATDNRDRHYDTYQWVGKREG